MKKRVLLQNLNKLDKKNRFSHEVLEAAMDCVNECLFLESQNNDLKDMNSKLIQICLEEGVLEK